MRRRALRPLGPAFQEVCDRYAPATPLAAVQRVWPEVAGAALAQEATPVSERDGQVTIACRSAVWAQELDLLSEDVLARLNAALDGYAVTRLRVVATGVRGASR